jgi:alkylation response protein AidB-like acyl-CoA dehydrogenase
MGAALEHPAVQLGYLGDSDEGAAQRLFKVLSIFGGTTEIQKEIIGRSLGL